MTARRASDRVALVTGASSGPGRQVALGLARLGYGVVVGDPRPGDAASSLADEIAATGRHARALPGDVADKVDVASVFASIEREEGRLDLLLFNAGAWQPPPHAQLTPEDWDECLGRAVTGAFYCSYHARPLLKEAGGQVIHVAFPRTASVATGPASVAARVGRAALRELTRALAEAFAPEVRVNMVSPGPSWDDGEPTAAAPPGQPAGAPGRVGDVMRAVRYLVGASCVSGIDIDLSGGFA